MEDGTEKWLRNTCDTDEAVSARAILDITGDKWSLLVVMLLHEGPMRFSHLKRSAWPISQRMLTRTLRQLEREGLVQRTVFPEVPPRVEYALTDLGETLPGAIAPLIGWANEKHGSLVAARERYDRESQGAAGESMQ